MRSPSPSSRPAARRKARRDLWLASRRSSALKESAGYLSRCGGQRGVRSHPARVQVLACNSLTPPPPLRVCSRSDSRPPRPPARFRFAADGRETQALQRERLPVAEREARQRHLPQPAGPRAGWHTQHIQAVSIWPSSLLLKHLSANI